MSKSCVDETIIMVDVPESLDNIIVFRRGIIWLMKVFSPIKKYIYLLDFTNQSSLRVQLGKLRLSFQSFCGLDD